MVHQGFRWDFATRICNGVVPVARLDVDVAHQVVKFLPALRSDRGTVEVEQSPGFQADFEQDRRLGIGFDSCRQRAGAARIRGGNGTGGACARMAGQCP